MGVGSGIYKFVLLLHITAVIAGFGITILAPFFGAEAKKRRGREGLAIAEALESVISTKAEYIIYSVPVWGILLVLLSDDAWKFSHAWISLAFLLFIAAVAVVHAVHLPNIKAMNRLVAALADGPPPGAAGGGPPPQVAELEARGKKVALVGMLLNLNLLVILVLMIWKPGA